MIWRQLNTRSATRSLSVASLVAALGVLALFSSTGRAATARQLGQPIAGAAQQTPTDCDQDGDSPYGLEFDECGNAPKEPGKLYTPADKARFAEQFNHIQELRAEFCGSTGWLNPMRWVAMLTPLVVPCTEVVALITSLDQMYADPPDPSVFEVASPLVQLSSGQAPSCPFSAATCRRGRAAGTAYSYAFEQEVAAATALSTSLNRLSSTPSAPESLYGSTPGAFPQYSRRTQVAAARLYSGLLAAWSDRMNTARARFQHYLDGVNRRGKRAAKHLLSGTRSASLWATYHKMNVYEIAQLFSQLMAQNIPSSRPTGQLAVELTAGIERFNLDLYNVYQATRAPSHSRARKLDAAANKFMHDADKFAAIPGLAAFSPGAPLSARLFGFAVEGLTNTKPAPVAAP